MTNVTDLRPDPPSSLRVGVLCHSSVGGSARVAAELARELVGRGHEVHLFARSVPALLSEGSGVALHTVHSSAELDPKLDVTWTPTDLAALSALATEVCRTRRLDVLHFHYALPFAQVVVKAQARLGADGPAVVGTLHGTDVSRAARRRLSMLDALDAVTTVSHYQAQRAMHELGLARVPLVIPNTIDLCRFHPAPALVEPPRAPRILHVSNFRAIKDPVRVAQAFAAVRRRLDAHLWLVGDGDQMPAVRTILDAAGVARDVRELGLRTDVDTIYGACDVAVLTSREESFSLVALEAAACGVPVIAPRVGGLPELVVDGVTGLLFDGDDASEPAASIVQLLTDGARRLEMGRAAAAHARAYSHEEGIPRYERIYRQVVHDRAQRPLAASGALSAV